MTPFPVIPETHRLQTLELPQGRLRIVLDTDTYNEIDDQFALVYALLSPERLQVEAVYAAPFKNDRADTPEAGMRASYAEIQRLYARLNTKALPPVYEGATRYLTDSQPEESAATADLIARALASPADDPIYVVAIGAIT